MELLKALVRRKSAVVSGVLLLAACGQNQSESQVKHQIDDPVNATSKSQWLQVSDDEYTDLMVPLLGLEDAEFLPADNEMVQLTQRWIDVFDANMRKRYADKMANVPKPSVRVIQDENPNAFIAPVPVCHEVSVTLDAKGKGEVERVFLSAKDGAIFLDNEIKCKTVAMSDADLADFAATWNKDHLTCRLSVSGSGTSAAVAVSEGCKLASRELKGVKSAKRLALFRTASYVTVQSGIIPMMGDKGFAAVLAHELGHYYRAHVSAADELFWYYYQLGDENVRGRPAPDAKLQEFGNAVRNSASAQEVMARIKFVPGQKIRPELFLALVNTARNVCSAGECSDACAEVSTLTKKPGSSANLKEFPYSSLSTSAETTDVKTLEAKSLLCLASMEISFEDKSTKSKLAVGDLLRAVMAPQWPTWTAARASRVRKLGGLVLNAIEPAELTGKADKFAEVLSARLDKLAKVSVEALTLAKDMHLGQYTAEQEADEYSTEWLAHVGVTPVAATDAYMSLLKWVDEEAGGVSFPFEQSYAECDDLRQDSWKTKTGDVAFANIGNYAEVHHSLCYRSFNTDREIAAWNYKVEAEKKKKNGVQRLEADFPRVAQLAIEANAVAPLKKAAKKALREKQKPTPVSLLALNVRSDMERCTFATHFEEQ